MPILATFTVLGKWR